MNKNKNFPHQQSEITPKSDTESQNITRGNDSKVFPKKTQEPQYFNYIVTDNKTNEHGCVINKSDIDATIAKRETDANKL